MRAFIVIDIQNDYFPGGALPLHHPEKVEEKIVNSINKAQAASDKLILIQHISNSDTGLFAKNGTGINIRPNILSASNGAPIVVKQYADAFQETELNKHLNNVDEILICGMMTQNCVVFTALSKDAEKYNIQVIGDLCTAPTELDHSIALAALEAKVKVTNSNTLWK